MLDSFAFPEGLLPEFDFGSGGWLRSLMFYEWEAPLDERCLFLAEQLLAEFGTEPVEGTGALTNWSGDQRQAHGDYKKVRAKLGRFLTEANQDGNQLQPSMRVRSVPRVAESGFFPCALEVTFAVAPGGQKVGAFSVDDGHIESATTLADRVEALIFGALGTAYGGCWEFPAVLGSEGYVATVSSMPQNMKWGVDEHYVARLNRWRDNIWHRKLRTRQGYFREIYPINFVLDAHLNASFQGAPLSSFMREFGVLRRCEFNKKMHRWDVPPANLAKVRTVLEPSGLVLSSATEPAILS